MTGSPSGARAKRRDRKPDNRLARVRAAVDAGDQIAHLQAAFDFARASIKRLPPEQRAAARSDLAELITNHALNDLSADNITRLEAVA